MKVAICTLGCKVNQYESQAMEQELLRRGYELAEFDGPADAYIINTCTVTAVSDKKCRNLIRRARRRAPESVVAVCGCYAQTDPQAVARLGVDLVSGSAGRMDFLDRLEEQLHHQCGQVMAVDEALARRQNSSVMVRGSREPSRSRISPASRLTVSSRSIRLVPSRRSWPQEEISMPVITSSR